MVAEPEFAEMLAELRESCGFVEHWLSTEETKGFESLAALMKTGGRTEEIPLALEDPYLIVPTAAVEGKPKGAVLTHGNTVAMGIQTIAHLGIKPGHGLFQPHAPFSCDGSDVRLCSALRRRVQCDP